MKRPPFRLGEYGPAQTAALRGLFFRAVWEIEVRSFQSLLALVPDCPADAAIGDATLVPLIGKIEQWGSGWRLTDAWCVDGALWMVLLFSHCARSVAQFF